jgi:Tfp pilus assembly protein PilE
METHEETKQFAQLFQVIVTIIIVSYLGYVAFNAFSKEQIRQRKSQCIINMQEITKASELYMMENPIPQSIAYTVKRIHTKGYLPSIPTCPSGGIYDLNIVAGSSVTTCTIHGSNSDTTSGL